MWRTKRATLGWDRPSRFLPLTIEGEGDDGGGSGDNADGAGGSASRRAPTSEGLAGHISPDDGDGGGSGEGDAGQGEGEGAGQGDRGDQSQGRHAEGSGDGEGEGQPTTLTFDERPDWVPEQFYDKESGAVDVQKLAKSWGDLRGKISKGLDKAPKDAAGYKIELSDAHKATGESLEGFFDDDGNDGPAMTWFRETAKEIGLSQDQFETLVGGYLDAMDEILPDPVDGEAELKKLGNKGQQILNGQANYLNGLRDKGMLTEGQHDMLFRAFLTTSEGVLALAALRTVWEGYQIPSDVTAQDASTETAEELRGELSKLMQAADKGEPGAQQKYERLMQKYEKLYGKAPAGTSRVAA